MVENKESKNTITTYLGNFLRRFIFRIISVGPIPEHIAFIMDGNRRYSKKCNLDKAGNEPGIKALNTILKYCYKLNVKYITVYAFSIDNFKRRPEEVKSLMELLRKKINALLNEEDTVVYQYGVKVHFVGDLTLLDESLRLAAEKAMAATSGNSNIVLSVCLAYTSTNEIVNAVEKSVEEKWNELKILDSCGLSDYARIEGSEGKNFVSLMDIEYHMLMKFAPSPDIVVRTSGENRLSNFLLWQSTDSILYSTSVLWPEIGLRHLVWAILSFQRARFCLYKKNK